ncbi:MAG TPA: hypothetical protein VHE30_23430 [Polyangiaceae bacterium]|nr:hypothetical protein [Polyangiaceae bacterium]
MSAKIVLVWLGATATYPGHEADLSGWAESRIATLEEPAPEARLEPAAAGDEIATEVESLLENARTASYADPRAAETALSSAELLLKGNPALPQAAWLMAETCRAHAALVKKEDPELAAILDRRAEILEGTRATAFGEEGLVPRSAGPAPSVRAGNTGADSAPSPPVPLRGPLAGDDVEIDGASSTEPRMLAAGEHHVRVLRRGRLAWAGWVSAESEPVEIALPPVVPCSETDFDGVRFVGSRVEIPHRILCPNWAVARDAGETRIEIARCERSSCGTLLPWSRAWGKELEGPMQPPGEPPPSHAWISWTVVSVVAATAAGILLVRSGAFDREGAPRDTVTFSGPGAR